eukprot:COSAG01_NODE_3849_length_5635_cov_89.706647_5_plen_68_part_00
MLLPIYQSSRRVRRRSPGWSIYAVPRVASAATCRVRGAEPASLCGIIATLAAAALAMHIATYKYNRR